MKIHFLTSDIFKTIGQKNLKKFKNTLWNIFGEF